MGEFQRCADSAIDLFVKKLGPSYYPNWADLIPGDDEKGWGADVINWRKQAKAIISVFEDCAQVKILRVPKEIDVLRLISLADFSDYLVEKAEHAAALLAVRVAFSNLKTIRLRHLETGLRAKVEGFQAFKRIRFILE